jgi:predicted cobalt transporter CbtA
VIDVPPNPNAAPGVRLRIQDGGRDAPLDGRYRVLWTVALTVVVLIGIALIVVSR